MVIKSEQLDMESIKVKTDAPVADDVAMDTALVTVKETTHAAAKETDTVNMASVQPPSKRPRLEPPMVMPEINPMSESATMLQDTLSTVIGNLGNLNPNQLATLAGLLSKTFISANGGGVQQNNSQQTQLLQPSSQYSCDMCPSTFHNQSDYFKHITFSHESDCGICLKSFPNHQTLEAHVMQTHQHHSSPPKTAPILPATKATCVVCKISFKDEASLEGHMNTHKQIFKCDLCGDLFAEHRNLELHLKAFHEQHRPHNCYACSLSFCTASELYKHISFTHDLDCTVCHQPFSSPDLLKQHMQDEHVFECCACAKDGTVKIFNSVESYDIHLRHFHKGTEFYKCINCKKRYISLTEFQSHVMEAHQAKPISDNESTKPKDSSPKPVEDDTIKAPTYKCQFCDDELSALDELVEHIRDRHEDCCVYCNVTCNKGELSTHVQEKHVRKCDICNVVFRAQYMILEHYADVHTELTVARCLHCTEEFITANELVNHCRAEHHQLLNISPPNYSPLQTPGEEPLIPCKACKYVAKSVYDLQKHCKVMHSLRCSICKTLLYTSRELDLHVISEHCVTCDVCQTKFSSKILLRNHITTLHPDKEIFTCRICVEHFNTEIELAYHVNTHMASRRPFSCSICYCKNKFQTKRDLEQHMSTAHNKAFFSCDICTHCFVSEIALHKHIEIYHENIVFFNCNKCPKKTLSKPELDKHIELVHKDDYEYTTCDICKDKFTNQSDYFKHISFAHDTAAGGGEPGAHKCGNCTASFGTEVELADHQLKAHQKNKFFVCKMCGVKFTSYYRLSRHMKLEHKGTEFFCDICNKSFSTTLALYRHQKTYHESELGVRICLTCGARLANQTQLQEHVAQHFNSLDLQCKQCNMAFSSLAALNDHNLFHQRQEYRCIDCGKTFPSQTDLKVHVSVDHVGMMMCQICEEAFQDEKALDAHVKLQHAADSAKSYRCTDCGESFSHSSELKVHVTLKHLGQTVSGDGSPKYNCIDCSESFTDKQTLKAHIASKHSGTLACNGCYMVFQSRDALADHVCAMLTIECKQCSAKFKHKAELEEHMISHISINVNEQYCTQCNQQYTSITELQNHDCKGKTISSDVNLKVSDLSNADLQMIVDSLSGMRTPKPVQVSPSKPLTPLQQVQQQVHTPMQIQHAVQRAPTPIQQPSTPPPPQMLLSNSTPPQLRNMIKPDPSPRSSPHSSPRKSNLASILGALMGPLGTSPEALLEALTELPPAKITEILSTLSANQDIISSLATNPPKLPDSLVTDQKIRATQHLPCPRCQNKFITKQALASHLQSCAAPTETESTQTKGGGRPDLKLIHRQLFLAAQNIDVSLLNITQVETLIQVLASEDGLRKVPQHRVVDLLDTIEKSVKIKEAKEKELKKKAAALRKMSESSPVRSPLNTTPLPGTSPVRNVSSPMTSKVASPCKPPSISDCSSKTCSPKPAISLSDTKAASPKPPSLTDCLPPEITAAILPAIKDENTDLPLLAKICTGMGGCSVSLPEWLTTHLTLAVTRSIQILQHPDNTNKSTLGELKGIIVSILGANSSSNNSIRQGMMNVLKRNYASKDLQSTSYADLDKFVQYLVGNVLPSLADQPSPNLLTLPFLLDLVLKNNKLIK